MASPNRPNVYALHTEQSFFPRRKHVAHVWDSCHACVCLCVCQSSITRSASNMLRHPAKEMHQANCGETRWCNDVMAARRHVDEPHLGEASVSVSVSRSQHKSNSIYKYELKITKVRICNSQFTVVIRIRPTERHTVIGVWMMPQGTGGRGKEQKENGLERVAERRQQRQRCALNTVKRQRSLSICSSNFDSGFASFSLLLLLLVFCGYF